MALSIAKSTIKRLFITREDSIYNSVILAIKSLYFVI